MSIVFTGAASEMIGGGAAEVGIHNVEGDGSYGPHLVNRVVVYIDPLSADLKGMGLRSLSVALDAKTAASLACQILCMVDSIVGEDVEPSEPYVPGTFNQKDRCLEPQNCVWMMCGDCAVKAH